MKNNLFCKANALILSSIVIFSGQALAFSDNNQELSNTNTLSNPELLVAQESVNLAVAVGVAVEAMCRVVTIVETRAVNKKIPPEAIPFVRQALQEAIGATSMAEATAKKDNNSSVVVAIAQVLTSLDNAGKAVATGDADTAKVQVQASADQAASAVGIASGGCRS